MKRLYTVLDLTLFDGEGGGDGGAAAGAADGATAPQEAAKPSKPDKNPLAKVVYGKQTEGDAPTGAPPAKEPETRVTTDTQDARRAEFEKLIKSDYKDLYDERTQQLINSRFKQVKALETKAAQVDDLAPVLDMLASKYGVEAGDMQNLVKAIQEDNSYYEDEAAQKGLTIEQLKQFKKMERENAEFKRATQERERQESAQKLYATWQQQATDTTQYYKGFSLDAEVKNPQSGERFVSLLRSGVDVRTAYEVVHKDELVGGAMSYAAQEAQRRTVDNIRARGMRPQENGAGGGGPVQLVKKDPKQFTKRDREEIARRVLRGERIEL